jgi:flagellar assembly protein FliH
VSGAAGARIVRGEQAARAEPIFAPGPSDARQRRVVREEMEGRAAAERIVHEARAKAEALLAQAREDAAKAAAEAARRAAEDAAAELAARWLALRQAEQRRTEQDAARILPIAIVLAERLLSASLELEPARVAGLARAVLAEARGARRAVVDANPGDAELLRRHLTTAGLDVQSVEIRDDAALARGELRLHTDVGTIDARLAPRFERLAAALRDSLR